MRNPAYQKFRETLALPSPVGVALEILRLANDSKTTAQQISSVIKKDPAIASRLLKFANSPLAGLSRRIISVSEAAILLGLNTVKSIALGFSLMSQARHGPCTAFDYKAFWSESVARAAAARNIAFWLIACELEPDEAFACGLLCQVGRLAFATALPDAYSDAIRSVDPHDPIQLIDIEREVFGIDHNDLAAEMMTDWHLPDMVCLAVRFQSFPAQGSFGPGSPSGRLARILHLAEALSTILKRQAIEREFLVFTDREASRLGIRPEVFSQVFDSIALEWPAFGSIFGVTTRKVRSWDAIYARAR